MRDSLVAWALGSILRRAAAEQGRDPRGLRLLEPEAFPLAEDPAFLALVLPAEDRLLGLAPPMSVADDARTPELLGAIQERLVDFRIEHGGSGGTARPSRRRRSGSYYTPSALAASVIGLALAPLEREVSALEPPARAAALLAVRACDPAMGGGVFLIELCRRLAAALHVATSRTPAGHVPPKSSLHAARGAVASHILYGCDLDPLAVATAEAALWLFTGDPNLRPESLRRRLFCGDALIDGLPSPVLPPPGTVPFEWGYEVAALGRNGPGFDLVIGNPPWVAFAGRAAQALDPAVRTYFSRRYSAWRGYPTLHGLFAARAATLAPYGVVALILPSSLADLDGYRAVRLALTARHVLREPLMELGQDAFESVVQPSMVLVADPDPRAVASARPWRLRERTHAAAVAVEVAPPDCVLAADQAPRLPKETFRELGFQTNRVVTAGMLRRASQPDELHDFPLLEGRDVTPFFIRAPRLFLAHDRDRLRAAGVRVRDRASYAAVDFVVRQTAAFPIAACHTGYPFRNTLLAGFATEGLDPELVVGLLNSTLYRAIHLARQRDARQAAFPQIKLSHLRALPAPPPVSADRTRVAAVARAIAAFCANEDPRCNPALAGPELDVAVFDLFRLQTDQRNAVMAFVATFTASSRSGAARLPNRPAATDRG
ncbi:MAG: hypothetical protein JW751_13435 [Polyangiaceae bacterium]|nr:hypothetical protein [Polyangiaceae bacterium]